MSEQPDDQAEAEAKLAATEAKTEAAKVDDANTVAASADEAKAEEGEAKAAEAEPSVRRAEEDDAVLDASGRERPRFLLAFPKHPELGRLAAAFEAGNYALVRDEAETLAERTDDPAVRDAALELRRRIAPDPLAKYLLGLTGALLLFLAWFAYHH